MYKGIATTELGLPCAVLLQDDTSFFRDDSCSYYCPEFVIISIIIKYIMYLLLSVYKL